MPMTITPTLSTKTGYIEDVRDQVATLIRFIIMNPGFVSELWEEQMLSFRTLSSKYEHEREGFASRLGSLIQEKLNHMFQDWNFLSDFSVSDYDEKSPDGRYTIRFSIIMNALSETAPEIPSLISGAIIVDPQTNEITLSYDQSMDTYSL